MNFSLTILGSGSALPAFGRHPSAQWLRIGNYHILIDCGEGTQFQMRKYGKSAGKLNTVCISHLHGDHIFGLPGLITSMILQGRTVELIIIGPEGIENMIASYLRAAYSYPNFPLKFIETNTMLETLVLNHANFQVKTIPLQHKVPSNGYLFSELPRMKNIDCAKIAKYNLSPEQIRSLKTGNTVVTDSGTLTPDDVLYQRYPPVSYAYCSDTVFVPNMNDQISGVDLLYHEATYMGDMEPVSFERGHSTTLQAGMIAKKAGVKKLLIGHPSSKYREVETLVAETQTVFPETEFAYEGSVYEF